MYKITYEDALALCKAYKDENFYKTETVIEGYKVVTFNYFMCAPEWFETPLPHRPEIKAYDMRGVTFVFNTDGTLFRQYLMLPKFFNVNQIEDTTFENIKDLPIRHVAFKEDGSLIAFMKLPNGSIFAKTQKGFTNQQSIEALKIYKENIGIKRFVDDMLSLDMTPLFEYVSYDNRIVLKYNEKKLILLGVRVNDFTVSGDKGTFIPAVQIKDTVKRYGIPAIEESNISTIDELMEEVKERKNVEGFVVYFDNGSIVKFKTHWYFVAHGIRTESIFREDYVIKNYLEDTLDDATQELSHIDDKDAFDFIETVKGATDNWINHINKFTDDLVKCYEGYDGDFGKFATENYRKPFFNLGRIKLLSSEEYKEKRNEFMLFNIRRLNMAKNIVEKFKNK